MFDNSGVSKDNNKKNFLKVKGLGQTDKGREA